MNDREKMDEQALQAEILRLNKIVNVLMNRAESNASVQGSDFNLFHTAVALDEQVRRRTRELDDARLENEKITRALRESEEKFRLLIENSHDIIYTLDKEGNFTFLSPAWSSVMGYSINQAMEQPALFFIHPDDVPESRDFIKRVMETGKRQEGIEYRVRRADGTWRWHTSSCVPLRDKTGAIIGIEGVARDVTERKMAEDALKESNRLLELATIRANAMAEEAAMANASKSAFLASMSHELRTPLNAILGFSEIIKDKVMGPASEKYFEYAEDIYTSGQHLLLLINDVLDLSKIDARQLVLKRIPLDVMEIVRECVRMTQARFQKRQQAISLDIQEPLPQIIADVRSIKQVILNLLSNANKYTQDGGHVFVSASHNVSENTVSIEVRDDGIGIAPDKQARVFEPYQQTGDLTVREKDGTGLGLAISRRLVELHGGTLTLSSVPGEGTTLKVVLPVTSPETETATEGACV